MISKIFIIAKDGVLCYSKSFFGSGHKDKEIINFLTSINHVGKNVGLGEIKKLNFTNLNVIYSYDDYNYMYIITSDIDDPEEEIRDKLELIKKEFDNLFHDRLEKWNGKTKQFKEFDRFTESRIFIPPKILLAGKDGVGKSTIMDLFPGETILELDDDMNEIIQKTINLPNLEGITEFILREVNLQDLIGYSKIYKTLLDSADIICIVTNSGAVNLSRTKQLFYELKQKANKADFFIIANFQDLVNTSFEPDKISESFGIKAFGFSAVRADAKDIIYKIITTIVKISIIDKIEKKYNHFV
ncbi:MAG: GTPase domain-containing protein [Candidatus Lokiarchaeota archaeon]|nr:GTPase domain-containing protein [Candidatus Lokiarchaeota archaeon]